MWESGLAWLWERVLIRRSWRMNEDGPLEGCGMESNPSPIAQAAFGAIVDYAGLFPPAALGLSEAVAEYERARNGPNAWMLGRFVVPASRMEELAGVVHGATPVC